MRQYTKIGRSEWRVFIPTVHSVTVHTMRTLKADGTPLKRPVKTESVEVRPTIVTQVVKRRKTLRKHIRKHLPQVHNHR